MDSKRVNFKLKTMPINAVAELDKPQFAISPQIDIRAAHCDRRLRRFKQQLANCASDMMALWVPVTLSLVTACTMTLIRRSVWTDESVRRVVLKPEVSLVVMEAQPALQQWQLILIAALVAVLIIIVLSFAIVSLLKNSCFAFLKCYVCVAFLILSCHKLCFWFYTASNVFNIPVDWITVTIISYNFMALVFLAVGVGDSAPKRLIQLLHILLSATIAYLISNVILQGNFAYASILCALFSAWDLFAVLCPRGPLNSLIKLAEKEQRVVGFMQPLLYSAAVWRVAPAAEESHNRAAPEPAQPKRPKRGSRLGLGDFIFYGVLMSTATSQCGVFGALACYAGLSVGFSLTLVALRLLDRALPALPLPVLAAIVPVALFASTGQPFSDALSDRKIML